MVVAKKAAVTIRPVTTVLAPTPSPLYSLVDRRWKFLIESQAKFCLIVSKILLLEVPNQ